MKKKKKGHRVNKTTRVKEMKKEMHNRVDS